MAATRTWTLRIKGDASGALAAAEKVQKRFKDGLGIDENLGRQMSGVQSKWDRFSSGFASKAKQFGRVAAAGIGAGIVAVGAGLVSAFKEADEAARIGRRTENVIKSMGASAWTSADGVARLSERLAAKSGVDDEVIQSGANLLLTFKNIRNETGRGNDIFNQTVGLANDMSVALGQDMKSSSIQLGKALNDPIKGVTALQRVGVSFTQGQKDQIKTLVESGRTLEAQKLILGEVQAQFGGAAAAAATPWDRLKVIVGNVQEEIGTALLPIAGEVADVFSRVLPAALDVGKRAFGALVDGFKTGEASGSGLERAMSMIGVVAAGAWPHVQKIGEVVGDFGRKVGEFFSSNPTAAWAALGTVLGGVFVAGVVAATAALWGLLAPIVPFLLIGAAIAAVVAGVVVAWQRWKGLRDVVGAVVDWFRGTAWPAIQQFIQLVIDKFGELVGWVRRVWPQIQEAIGHVVNVIQGIIGVFVNVATALWKRFGDTLLGAAKTAWNLIRSVVESVINVIRGIIETVLALINGDWGKAWDGMYRVLRAVWDAIWAVVSAALGVIRTMILLGWNSVLGITNSVWNAIKSFIGVIWGAIYAVIAAVLRVIQGAISAAWNAILAAAKFIWGVISGAISAAWGGIKSAVSGAVEGVKGLVDRGFTWVKDRAMAIWEALRKGVGAVWGAIVDAVKQPVNLIIGLINGLIGGLNKVLGLLPGIDIKIPTIPKLEAGGQVASSNVGSRQTFRSARLLAAGGMVPVGAGWVTNGPQAIVGEGNPAHPEFVVPTDPKYRGRASALWGALGEKLGMPMMAKGGILGDIFGAGARFVKGIGGAVAGLARKGLVALFDPIAKRVIGSLDRLPQVMHLPKVAKAAAQWAWDWVKGADSELPDVEIPKGGPGVGPLGSGVERWRETAVRALIMAGQSVSWVNDLLAQMRHESGGNPNAINNWDVNAKRGTPSKGLLQVIQPTFDAYAGALRGRGIFDPLANIFAAINYTVARYGTLGAWRQRGFKGYARGGIVGPGGGYVHPREMVLTPDDQRRLLGIVRDDRPGGMVVTVAPGAVVIGVPAGSSPADAARLGRAAGGAFLDRLAERQIMTDARVR